MYKHPDKDPNDSDNNEGTGIILWVFISFGILTGGIALLLWVGC